MKKNSKIKKVHRNLRYVDNGKVITSVGVDAAFYLMSKIIGEEKAKAAANRLEYIYWGPKKNKY